MTETDSSLILPAPAKLNLFLHITGRRDDGYHNLQTVFQLLDHGDELKFKPCGDGLITLEDDSDIDPDTNLVIRAARLLQQHCGISLGATIHLRKRLPIGAGLGGGSSDAATTLLGLNRLWNADLPTSTLLSLGRRLGADVPVFINGMSAWAQGIGEKLQTLALPKRWYLVLSPPSRISTGEIFNHRQLTRNSAPITIPGFPFSGCRNDCEAVVRSLYPEVEQAFQWLGRYSEPRLTGTGSSLFAIFEKRDQAERILVGKPDWLHGFIAAGVNKSPLHLALESAG